MVTVADVRRETREAIDAIRADLEAGCHLSRREILERHNGREGEFSATAVHNAILELLESGDIQYAPDGRLYLQTVAA